MQARAGVSVEPTRTGARGDWLAGYQTPLRSFLILSAALFLAEVAVMWVLDYLPEFNPWVHYVLDSSMMLLLSFPALYFFVLQPLHQQLQQRRQLEAELERHGERLEQLVEERTRELKNSNAALQATREDLNRAQTVARTGSWRLDVRANNLLWSEETYRIFGLPPGTPLTYELFLERVFPEDRPYVQRQWEAALKGAPYDIEHRVIAGSSIKWIREKAELEFEADGTLRGGFGTAQDITDLRVVEDKLRVLTRAMEAGPAGVVITDAEGTISYVNRAFTSITGYGLEEVMGLNPRILKSGHHEPAHYIELWRTLKQGNVWRGEFCNRKKNGELFWTYASICPVRDPSGQINHMVAVTIDITERKQFEQELKQAHQTLERRVEQRTADLNSSLKALKVEIEARRRAEAEIKQMLHLERLVTEISADFASLKPGQFHGLLESAVSRLMNFLKADAAILAEFVGNTTRVTVSCEARQSNGTRLQITRLPWTTSRLRNGERVYFTTLDQLPNEGAEDREGCRSTGVQAVLAVPLVVSEEAVGALLFVAADGEHTWSAETVRRMPIVENLFSSQLLRWRSEQALSEAETRFHAIADFVRDWEYWESPEGALLFCSPACEAITGYRPEQFLVEPGLLKKIVLPEDSGVWTEHHREVFADPHPHSLEFRIRGADDQVRWIQHYSQPIFDGAQFLGFRVNNRDITRIKETELETQRLQAELSRMSRAATADQLAASLAHELRQPLTAIMSNAEAAGQFLAQEPPDLKEVSEALSDIVDNNERASQVIRRLRALYRKTGVEHGAVDLNKVIEDTLGLLRSELILRRVSWRLELQPDLATTLGNRVELQQVVMNLVLNAADAMNRIIPEARLLVISSAHEGLAHVRVAVRDCGVGFDRAAAEKLFEPFFTTKESGMGMGLTLCRSIIKAHGGRLWGENNPSAGATFYFTVPIYQRASL